MEKKATITKKIVTILFSFTVACTILYIAYSAYLYNTRVRERLSSTTLTTLSEIASQQQFSVSTELEADIASIKSIAYSLVVLGYDRSDILNYLNVIESFYGFDNITILDITRTGIMSDGREVIIENNDFYDKVFEGETLISEPTKSIYSNSEVVVAATPIFEFGEIVGIVAAEFRVSYLNELLIPSFQKRGYAYVINSEGRIIARTRNVNAISTVNLFDTLNRATFTDGLSAQKIKESIASGESGNFTFIYGDQVRILEYRPLSFTNWSIVVAIPEGVLNRDTTVILRETNIFNIKLLSGAFIVLLFFIYLRTSSINATKKAAYYDSVTGIPNLTKFKMEVAAVLKKHSNKRFTIVSLDIVNFKTINDFYDFSVGDKVLKAIANTGRTVKDKIFIQGRIGRDEFLLFSTYEFFSDLENTRLIYEGRFRSMVPEIQNHVISYRYGRYTIENNNEDVNSIVNKVLLAHSYGKNNTKNAICDYNDEFKNRLIKSTELTNKQIAALENNEFKMVLQPKCRLKDGQAVGAEALVRWHESDGNMIFPNDFIPLFEVNGFIVDLDMYMLEKVCQTLAAWKKQGYTLIPISVNFSRRHLELDNFAGKIEAVSNRYGIEKSLIEIELTEGIFLENENALRVILSDLHDRGFTLSMDDFGTGYSSLGLLHSFPVDVIKLDRSFVAKTEEALKAAIIVESVAQMTQKLGIPTVAEGVETKGQVEFLLTIGCEVAQGYYYSKPISVSEFEQNWLTKE